MIREELDEALALLGGEAVGPGAQEPEPRAVPAQGRAELTSQAHEVKADDPDRVEAVRDDGGVGEPLPDHRAVGAREINADDAHPVAAAQRPQVARELGLAPAG